MDVAWCIGSINRNTPAFKLLELLLEKLSVSRPVEITVFGPAAIQIAVEPSYAVNWVDAFSDSEGICNLRLPESDINLRLRNEQSFRATGRWGMRTHIERTPEGSINIPHPIDILMSELVCLDEVGIEAFQIVRKKIGRPTEGEFIHELQLAVDLFRPNFEDERDEDIENNCRRIWPLIFGREINVRREIIKPALEIRRVGFAYPDRDYKQELRNAVASYGRGE